MSERKAGRPSSKAAHIEEVKRLYLDEEWTLGEISAHIGKSIQTLSRWLQSEGVEIQARTRNPNAGRTAEEQAAINAKISASIQTSEKKRRNPGGRRATREVRTCVREECLEFFQVRPKAPQQYCSMSCAKKDFARQKSAQARQEWEQNPKGRCQCGGTIPYENRHIWRYCSDACRQRYGAKRQADPANYATFECLNCDKEVTRLRIQGSHKYCSNACAAKHTRVKKHIVVDDAVVLDSGYEALLWGLCAFLKVPIERFDRADCIPFGEEGWYGPDFVITLFGETYHVEVKGFEDEDDVARYVAWREQRGPLVVLGYWGLTQMRRGTAHDWPHIFRECGIATITKTP